MTCGVTRLIVPGFVAFCVAFVAFFGFLVRPSATPAPTAPVNARAGIVTIDRGLQSPISGSTWQASQIVDAIDQNPNIARYILTASDAAGEQLEVAADFAKNQITRSHRRPGGHGTEELWQGYVLE